MSNDKTLGFITGRRNSSKNTISLDYDDMDLEEVREDIENLQEKFKLGDALVSKSSEKSFHIFFFQDLVSWEELETIVAESSCDEEFKEFKEKVGFSRMRVGEKGRKGKPKILTVIKSEYGNENPLGKFRKKVYNNIVGD